MTSSTEAPPASERPPDPGPAALAQVGSDDSTSAAMASDNNAAAAATPPPNGTAEPAPTSPTVTGLKATSPDAPITQNGAIDKTSQTQPTEEPPKTDIKAEAAPPAEGETASTKDTTTTTTSESAPDTTAMKPAKMDAFEPLVPPIPQSAIHPPMLPGSEVSDSANGIPDDMFLTTSLWGARSSNMNPMYMQSGLPQNFGQRIGPSTIAPSNLHSVQTEPMANNGSESVMQVADELEMANEVLNNLKSFARIEFQDSTFQMTTYAVIIGRDRAAIKQAQRRARREESWRLTEGIGQNGLPLPPEDDKKDARYSKSYMSTEGGILGPESEGDDADEPRPAKRRKTNSTTSSKGGHEIPESRNLANNIKYVSHTPGAVAVDVESLRPSTEHIPFLGIHSPGPDVAQKSKGISREHLMIKYNKKSGVFEATALHNNGFFVEDKHIGNKDPVVLKSGVKLQIKDVDFVFYINGAKEGCTGAEGRGTKGRKKPKGGKEMSFDFEQAHGNSQMQDTSDEELSEVDDDDIEEVDLSNLRQPSTAEASTEDQPMEDAPEPDKPPTESLTPQDQTMADASLGMLQIPKKRGPGRPPKNGIMSKREQREIKKAQQELAKREAAQAPPIEPPIKRKVGRPRKHPLPEGVEGSLEKRKYKPRKSKNEDGAEGSDVEKQVSQKKSKLPPRSRTPPLELKREDYTEAQLQKPNKNYGQLINEALLKAPDGLSLKQIYKRICEQYPWFYFETETKGWESSVRHNLIGNSAFYKDEMGIWRRDTNVELEAGKKRKATSPEANMAAQAYNNYPYTYGQGQQQMAPGASGYPPGPPPQGYQIPNYNPQQPGQAAHPPHHQFVAPVAAAQQAGHPLPPQVSPAVHAPGGHHPPPSPAVSQGGQQTAGYNSPYATATAPAAGNPPIKTEGGTAPVPGAAPAPSAFQMGQKLPATPGMAQHAPRPSPTMQQQAQHNPPATQAAAPATPSTFNPHSLIAPIVLKGLTQLRENLTNSLVQANTPHAQELAWSALDRIVGLRTEPSGLNNKLEGTCYDGFKVFIQRYAQKSNGNTSASPATLLPPHVTKHLLELRDQCVTTIKRKFPEKESVTIVHSAIMRTLGLAKESRVRGAPIASERLESTIMQNVVSVLTKIGRGGSQDRGSSAGPRRSSATPQASTPAMTPATPVTHISTPVPASQAPAAPPTGATPHPQAPPSVNRPSATPVPQQPANAPQTAPGAAQTSMATQVSPAPQASAPPQASAAPQSTTGAPQPSTSVPQAPAAAPMAAPKATAISSPTQPAQVSQPPPATQQTQQQAQQQAQQPQQGTTSTTETQQTPSQSTN